MEWCGCVVVCPESIFFREVHEGTARILALMNITKATQHVPTSAFYKTLVLRPKIHAGHFYSLRKFAFERITLRFGYQGE